MEMLINESIGTTTQAAASPEGDDICKPKACALGYDDCSLLAFKPHRGDIIHPQGANPGDGYSQPIH